MDKELKILLLEDRLEDVEIIKRELVKRGLRFQLLHAEDKDQFVDAIQNFKPHLILSDYSLPSFNGLDALNLVRELQIDIPFIFVTGSINEETAVECIKKGATDYIIKENLKRLIPAITNAIEKFESKREKEEAQKALLKSEEKFIHAFNYANIGMCLINMNGNFIKTNSKFSKLCGYTNEELLEKTVFDITFDDELEITKQFYTNFLSEKNDSAVLEKRYKHKNGSTVWVFISISLVKDSEGKPDFFVSHIQDITQKKKDEEEIRKLSKSVEQSPVMVVITDINGKIEYVNSKYEEITGYTFDEVVNKTPNILKTGKQTKEFYKNLWDTINAGKVWIGEFLNTKKNGELFWESASISTLVDNKNKPSHYILIKQDISAQKLMEQSLIEAKEKAEESDRLKSAFLANVSHEIRTPMNGILGFSDLLKTEELTKDQQVGFIDIIVKSGNQLLNIVNDILDISKIESGQLRINEEIFSINDLLLDLKHLIDERVRSTNKNIQVELVSNLEKNIFIKTDLFRLKQILQNLLSNAEKFTNSGIIKFGYTINDQTLNFFVSDTGIGIQKKNFNSIFDRFRQENETISKNFGGTGLGLSISRGLVELLGGKFKLESTPSKGSTFSFTLPRVTSDEIPVEKNQTKSEIHFNGESILIVEDVDENFYLLEEYLNGRNLLITRAISGSEAIEKCMKIKDLKLVLMDIKLPDLNGYDATRAIKKFKPELPIIAQTAFAMENEKIKCLEAGCDSYLSKPIAVNDLLNMVEKYLYPQKVE